jgi:hypothetical protein
MNIKMNMKLEALEVMTAAAKNLVANQYRRGVRSIEITHFRLPEWDNQEWMEIAYMTYCLGSQAEVVASVELKELVTAIYSTHTVSSKTVLDRVLSDAELVEWGEQFDTLVTVQRNSDESRLLTAGSRRFVVIEIEV